MTWQGRIGIYNNISCMDLCYYIFYTPGRMAQWLRRLTTTLSVIKRFQVRLLVWSFFCYIFGNLSIYIILIAWSFYNLNIFCWEIWRFSGGCGVYGWKTSLLSMVSYYLARKYTHCKAFYLCLSTVHTPVHSAHNLLPCLLCHIQLPSSGSWEVLAPCPLRHNKPTYRWSSHLPY